MIRLNIRSTCLTQTDSNSHNSAIDIQGYDRNRKKDGYAPTYAYGVQDSFDLAHDYFLIYDTFKPKKEKAAENADNWGWLAAGQYLTRGLKSPFMHGQISLTSLDLIV